MLYPVHILFLEFVIDPACSIAFEAQRRQGRHATPAPRSATVSVQRLAIRNLEYLFKPKCIAVIGASDTPHSVGAAVMRNLLQGGFSGPITPVNPKYRKVAGVRAFPSVASLEETPDLAVICTPPQTVPGLIAELGSRGTKAAVVLSAGLAAIKDGQGRSPQKTMLEAARPHRTEKRSISP